MLDTTLTFLCSCLLMAYTTTSNNSTNSYNIAHQRLYNNLKPEIKYDSCELHKLRYNLPRKPTVVNNNLTSLHGLDIAVVQKIRSARIQKRRKRGKKKGQNTLRYTTNVDTDNANTKKRNIKTPLTCALINCRSVKNKSHSISSYMDENNIEICILTEIWLKDKIRDQAWINCCDLNNNGKKLILHNRPDEKRGGGLGLVYNNNIKVKQEEHFEIDSFECVVWSLHLHPEKLHIMTVYRPPNLSTINSFTNSFISTIENALPKYKNLIITGDFNIHVEDLEDSSAQDFVDTVNAIGLKIYTSFETHKDGHFLDLVISQVCSKFHVNNIKPGDYLSDHRFVIFNIEKAKNPIIRQAMKIRNLRQATIQNIQTQFPDNLCENLQQLTSTNEMAKLFESVLSDLLNKVAPEKEKIVRKRKLNTWYSDIIKEQKKITRKKEKKWRSNRIKVNWEEFKIERNKLNKIIRQEKKRVLSEKIIEAGTDTKKLYKLVGEMTGKSLNNPMPENIPDKQLVEQFADFFLNKILKIRDALKDKPLYKPNKTDAGETLQAFNVVSEVDIKKIVMSLSTKTCELDCLPTSILKENLDLIVKPLTIIINKSLNSADFPLHWKCAIVRPLLKKPGLDLSYNNYRPVSNLSFISKVLEKTVLNQFTEHCEKARLIPDYQSAYRKGYSCETALLKLVNDILWNMENQKLTAMTAIDLSAAFDTVDHQVLLNVLENKFGIKDQALIWFQSYLQPRSFKVCVNNNYSIPRDISFSVPQGSINGASLYSIYASTIKDVIPDNTDIHGYADDHCIKKSYKATEILTAERETIASLQLTLTEIKNWMDMNRLKMNDTKTEFITFGSSKHLQKVAVNEICVNDCNITRSSVIKYLGALLDSRLNFKDHIKSKCKVASYHLYLLREIRNCLTLDAAKTVALGMIISHLDYANSLYIGLPKGEQQKLQRIQNLTAKIVLGRNKYSSSTDALKSLHWLPIHLRSKYKICVLMFNCRMGQAPVYLQELLLKKDIFRHGLRSNNFADYDYVVPFCKHSSFADRSFSIQGPKCWNALPVFIKCIGNLKAFKKALKTHLFKTF